MNTRRIFDEDEKKMSSVELCKQKGLTGYSKLKKDDAGGRC